MEAVETVEYLGYKINIGTQEDPEDPRKSMDNLGTMVCNHGKYTLGDEVLHENGESFINDLARDLYPDEMNYVDNGDKEFVDVLKLLSSEYYFMPLKLSDHSGISMSTGGHQEYTVNNGYDSGMVGFIHISKEKAYEEYGLTELSEEAIIQKTYECMEEEIKTYNQYLTGEIYSYEVDHINEGWGHECYSIEEATEEAKEYINDKDPDGEILKEAISIYETELDNFWDRVGDSASEFSEVVDSGVDEEKKDLIINIVGELLRAY